MPITVGNTTITFNDGTSQSTASSGGVTSLNGQTGAITNTSFQAIGSYVLGLGPNANSAPSFTTNSTYSGGSIRVFNYSNFAISGGQTLTGTWRALGSTSNASSDGNNQYYSTSLFVRIS